MPSLAAVHSLQPTQGPMRQRAQMALTFIHLSDIHFGQEKGSEIYVHDDVKECLITDLAELKVATGIERMGGVIVTGDVAFSGKKSEYDSAAQWLDRLTQAIGCEKTDVIVVPGNHDIDRDRITPPAKLMLHHLHEGGVHELERFLADPMATEMLYDKFNDYRTFAEGYGCPLLSDGGVAVTRQVAVAPGCDLRFVGLNSALLCTGNKTDEGKLLIGGRQHVLPRDRGCELVVLCHHPLESLQDGEVVTPYIRSRARVHVFGHVHQPSVTVDTYVDGADLLTISAGAVVPPDREDGYQYTYNFLSFDWDANTKRLKVEIVPRTWDEEATQFDADTTQFGTDRLQHSLRCPNFVGKAVAAPMPAASDCPTEATRAAVGDPLSDAAGGSAMERSSDLLRLHFFRDLSAEQRLQALVEVGLLTDSWTSVLTHTLERRLFDRALNSGLEAQLASAVAALRTVAATAERSEEG